MSMMDLCVIMVGRQEFSIDYDEWDIALRSENRDGYESDFTGKIPADLDVNDILHKPAGHAWRDLDNFTGIEYRNTMTPI